MHQIAPEMILENYANGIYSGKFNAVGIFVDISGFSTLTDVLMQHGQHGAEVLTGIMRNIFDPLNNDIIKRGGFIVGFAGDAVTALFRYDDDPKASLRQALAAAWAIQEQMAASHSVQTVYGSFSISAKVGLAQGDVRWGILRSRDGMRATYYFSGDAVNESAAAEHHARSGEIILTCDVYELLDGEIACASLVGEAGPAPELEKYFLLTGIQVESVALEQVAPAQPDLAVLRVFFPEILLKDKVPSEFRQVVNVFIQLPDLTQEALAEFMAEFFDLEERYGGILSRIDFGDKGCSLLLFWGAPIAYENDILRALNFIWRLRARCKVPIRAGVSYYVASAGFIGSDQREEYTCYGRGVNLAARLMTGAAFGEIRLDENVARRAQLHFELIFVGEQSLKGLAQIQKIYLLGGTREVEEILYRGQMFGRTNELEALEKFLEPMWDKKYTGSLVIWGEAGFGKSRLIYEFQRSELFEKHATLWAHCQTDQILRQSLNPFRYWLRRYFGVLESNTPVQNISRFQLRLQSLIDETRDQFICSELKRTSSFLAALIDMRWENSLYEQLDAQARYDNTFIALSVLIKAEGLGRPLVLLIEDGQYLDDDSLKFLEYLKRALLADPDLYSVAVFITSRPEGSIYSSPGQFFEQQIVLQPVSAASLSRLAAIMLNGNVGGNLLRLLQDRSEGNPFFAEQILQFLLEENLLRQSNGDWDLNISAPSLGLPVDIHALLVARLDQLDQPVRDVILAASILGREFDLQILMRMLGENDWVPAAIREAENASIWSGLENNRYLFHNSLLRDAAYTMQMQTRREEYHALAVTGLESVYSAQLKNHYAELSYHAEQARLVEKACHYLKLAGDAAREAHQNKLAVDYYSRALRLTPEGHIDQLFSLLLGREEVFGFQGDKEFQQMDLDTLTALSEGFLDKARQAEVGLRKINFLVYSGHYKQAAPQIKANIFLAKAAGNPEIVVKTYSLWAVMLYRQGNLERAIRQSSVGLKLARKIGDAQSEAQLLNMLGLVYLEQKHLERAKGCFEESLAIANQVNSLTVKARILNNLGMLSGYYGDLGAAQSYYEQALSLAQEVGDYKGESIVLSNLGWIAATMGDYQAGRGYTEKTLRISRETGDQFTETYTLINLSSQAGAWGENESALEYARQALALAKSIGDPSGQAWALTYLGNSLFAIGELSSAIDSYEAAATIRQDLNQPALAAEPEAGLARVMLALGNLKQAQEQVNKILEHIDTGGELEGADEPLRVYLNCYLVLRAASHPRANEILQTAQTALAGRVAKIQDETAKKGFLENISCNREILAAWKEQGGVFSY